MKQLGESTITRNTTVDLWDAVSPGSGMCMVKFGQGQNANRADYHIYGEAEEFVAEVQREIDRAPE